MFVYFGFDLFCVRWEGVVVVGGGGGAGGVQFGPECGVQQHPVLPSWSYQIRRITYADKRHKLGITLIVINIGNRDLFHMVRHIISTYITYFR